MSCELLSFLIGVLVVVVVEVKCGHRLRTSSRRRSYLGYPSDPFACKSVLATIDMRPSCRPSWWHGVNVLVGALEATHCPGTLPFPPPPPPILTVAVDLRRKD